MESKVRKRRSEIFGEEMGFAFNEIESGLN